MQPSSHIFYHPSSSLRCLNSDRHEAEALMGAPQTLSASGQAGITTIDLFLFYFITATGSSLAALMLLT
jgi:hypothetical protein